jgi:DNA-directed RNA polymerase specialized sigma24 family protein
MYTGSIEAIQRMPGGTHNFGFSGDLQPASSPAPDPNLVAAIDALTDKDFSKLHANAVFLFNRIRYVVSDKNEEDLLNEAMMRALAGARNWKPEKVNLVPFLIGCMESIVDHWRKIYSKSPSVPFQESFTSGIGQIPPEFQVGDDFERVIRKFCEDDEEAWKVLDLLMDGCEPAEIREKLHLSLNAYNAAAKRARRRAHEAAFAQLQTARQKNSRGLIGRLKK